MYFHLIKFNLGIEILPST